MKVYCKECKYLKSLCNEGLMYYCCHPENIIVVDSWLGTYNKYKREPSKINKNNDCKWFEQIKICAPPKRP